MSIFHSVGSIPDCLPYLPSSAYSVTNLESNAEGDNEGTYGSFDEQNNPNMISSITSSKDGDVGTAQGLEVIQNISVKDGCVIGFMLALWLYSMILMFRYLFWYKKYYNKISGMP